MNKYKSFIFLFLLNLYLYKKKNDHKSLFNDIENIKLTKTRFHLFAILWLPISLLHFVLSQAVRFLMASSFLRSIKKNVLFNILSLVILLLRILQHFYLYIIYKYINNYILIITSYIRQLTVVLLHHVLSSCRLISVLVIVFLSYVCY